jgi:hypothetical protein
MKCEKKKSIKKCGLVVVAKPKIQPGPINLEVKCEI